jgi:DNA-binding CsgD family transcriptional regulator
LRFTDMSLVDASERQQILQRYRRRAQEFESVARGRGGGATVISLRPPAIRVERLSPRELQILALIADGYQNAEIAHGLDLSQETIKTHVRHLLFKLVARGRAHAVTIGFRQGFLS